MTMKGDTWNSQGPLYSKNEHIVFTNKLTKKFFKYQPAHSGLRIQISRPASIYFYASLAWWAEMQFSYQIMGNIEIFWWWDMLRTDLFWMALSR